MLFVFAAIAEIGGAWLVWQGVREHRGLLWVGAGIIGLGPLRLRRHPAARPHFGRILAAYGGIFVAGSLALGLIFDGFRPNRSEATRHDKLDGFSNVFRWSTPGPLSGDAPRHRRELGS